MNIAIASGKGGTGKTTVATKLAYVASQDGRAVAYLDCNVEEPNGHIFLKRTINRTDPVCVLVPQVAGEKCTGCEKCTEICQYGAILNFGKNTLIYRELCHSCGGCVLACPSNAIVEVLNEVGQRQTGAADGIAFAQGLLNVGEPQSPPVIKGELSVCYRYLIATALPVTVRGWIERSSSRLHGLQARARQAGQVKATATGKFMDKLVQAYQGHTTNGKIQHYTSFGQFGGWIIPVWIRRYLS